MRKVEIVKLKNGTEEALILVAGTMMTLETFMKEQPSVLDQLLKVCENPEHKPIGDIGEVLEYWSMIQADGKVHDSVRNIVLSAVRRDGLDLIVESPVAGQ